ncbi:MAG TPA: ComEA family DNA-binding protein [Clostridia bacterium]|jgi:competence protein ComEA|nr:ComEA family DNA-binding protein [Clostridia bacterium]
MVLICALSLSGNIFRSKDSDDILLKTSSEEIYPEENRKENLIKVHVIGAVNRSGVYELPEGSRVIDAVQAAGGLSEDADLNATNLAAPLSDGQQVRVYNLSEQSNLSNSAIKINNGETTIASGKININTANKQQLENLTGIGPALAERIIKYRETNGYFRSIEELKNVSGIGEKRFEQLKDEITIY